jgi:hypothetical protein
MQMTLMPLIGRHEAAPGVAPLPAANDTPEIA